MRVLTSAEMRSVDRRAIEELGIPGMVLMENAAIGVADAIGERFPEARTLSIFCGPGNNGGDGLAVARHLDARGYALHVFLLGGRSPLSGDALRQLEILQKAGRGPKELEAEDDLAPAIATALRSDLLVDALFGTGLSRPLGGHFAELVEALDDIGVPILAVDIPSGLDGSRALPPGAHLRADVTVTFAAPKLAHVLEPAASAAGELVVTDLGIPPELVDEAPGLFHLSTETDMASTLLVRSTDAHKGSYGHALVVGGSPGKSGAVLLATRAAVRAGAGLVTALVSERLLDAVDGGSIESMTRTLPAHPDGDLSALAVEPILAFAEGKQALAIGPGLGTGPGAADVVARLVAECPLPLVLDADALNTLVGRTELLEERARRGEQTVLTPHPGEAARLLGTDAAAVQRDRLGAVERLARTTGSVVVLKGHRTLIARVIVGRKAADDGSDDGEDIVEVEVWVNPTGNSGMATGGTGDVLTGVLASLLAQGYDVGPAARLAVWVHGAAGDLAAESRGRAGTVAGDLVSALPEVFRRLGD